MKYIEEGLVPGLKGINKGYVGRYSNHEHICELVLLGMIYKSKKKEVESFCPYKIKYKEMNSYDECDNCIHNRYIELTDDGNHITDIY